MSKQEDYEANMSCNFQLKQQSEEDFYEQHEAYVKRVWKIPLGAIYDTLQRADTPASRELSIQIEDVVNSIASYLQDTHG